MSKWSTEGANLYEAARKKAGVPSLESLDPHQKEAAALKIRELFQKFNLPSRGDDAGLSTEVANEIRREFELGKWIPLSLLVSDSRHRIIRNNDCERHSDVVSHQHHNFDVNLMWQRNKHESDNSFSRIETDINNQSSFLYRSIVELLSNAIDASNPSLKKIGRFGVGFYQIFQHLRKNSDFITLCTTRSEDTHATRLLFRKGEHGVEVSMSTVPKDGGRLTGTTITIEAAHLNPSKAEPLIKRSLQWNSDAKIRVNGKAINGSTLRRFCPDTRDELPVVSALLEEGRFTIEDRGHGMSVDDLLHKLLIPKLSGKKSVRELAVEHEPPTLRWTLGDLESYQKGTTVVLVGGVRVAEFVSQGVNRAKVLLVNLPHSTKLTEERDGVYPDFLVQKAYRELISRALSQPLNTASALINGLLPIVRDFDRKNTFHAEPNFLLNVMREEILRVFPDVNFLPNVPGSRDLGLDYGTFTLLDSSLLSSRLCRIQGVTTLSSIQSLHRTPNIASAPFTNPNTLYCADSSKSSVIVSDQIIENLNGQLEYLIPALRDLTGTWCSIEENKNVGESFISTNSSLEAILNVASPRLGFCFESRSKILARSKEYPRITKAFLTHVWPYLQPYQQFDGITLLEDALWAQEAGINEKDALKRLRVIGENLKLFSESRGLQAEITSSLPDLFEIWRVYSCTNPGWWTSNSLQLLKTVGPSNDINLGYTKEHIDKASENSDKMTKIVVYRFVNQEGVRVNIEWHPEYQNFKHVSIIDPRNGYGEAYYPHERYRHTLVYPNRRYEYREYTQSQLNTLASIWIDNKESVPNFLSPKSLSQFQFTDTRIHKSGRNYDKRYSRLLNEYQRDAIREGYSGKSRELGTETMIFGHPQWSTNSALLSKRIFYLLNGELTLTSLSKRKIAIIENFINRTPLLNRTKIGQLMQYTQTAASLSDALFEDLLPSMITGNSSNFYPLSSKSIQAFSLINSPSREFRSFVISQILEISLHFDVHSDVIAEKLVSFLNLAGKYMSPASLRSFFENYWWFSKSCITLFTSPAEEIPDAVAKEELDYHSGVHQVFIRYLLGRDQSLAAKGINDPERISPTSSKTDFKLSELIAWSQTHQRRSASIGQGDLEDELHFLQSAVEEAGVGKNLSIIRNEITHAVEATTDQPYRWAIELISNALDAEKSIHSKDTPVSIGVQARALKSGECCFSVSDRKGMNLGEVVRYLLIPGQSSKLSAAIQIGFFGQGFFTALQFAQKIVVQSKKGADKEGLQITIRPIREGGLVVDAELHLTKIKTKKDGTTVHWIGTHENPGFWISEVGSAVQSNFRYLDPTHATIRYNGSKNSAKRKLLTVGECGTLGKIRIWMTNDYFDSVTVKGLPVAHESNGGYHTLPRRLLRKGGSFPGLQIELPEKVQLTRSRKGVAGGQLEEFDLSKNIARLICETFLKQLQTMPARDVAALFPFHELPTGYFTNPECFNQEEQMKIASDAKALMSGETLSDTSRYETPEMIARLMSFMPIFTIKRKKYSLEELKDHYAKLSGPFNDTLWLFSFKNDGTSNSIREYLYSINITKQIEKFDVQHPYLGYCSFDESETGRSNQVVISPAPLEDFFSLCEKNELDSMRNYRSELESLERQTKLLLDGILEDDEVSNWSVLFEGSPMHKWQCRYVRVSHEAKEIVWNAGALVKDQSSRSNFMNIPRNFLSDTDGIETIFREFASHQMYSCHQGESERGSWSQSQWKFHYWMKLLGSGNVDRFRFRSW